MLPLSVLRARRRARRLRLLAALAPAALVLPLSSAASAAASAAAPAAGVGAPVALRSMPAAPVVVRRREVAAGTVSALRAPSAERGGSAADVTPTPRSTWQVTFRGDVGGPATTGLAEKAVRRAVATWAGLVASPVPIKLDVTFAPTDPGVLGSTSPSTSYIGTGLGNGVSYYPSALADALTGSDVASQVPGAPASDIDVAVSSSEPDIYYGTDGRPGPGQIDFETVALHEIAHGLGLTGWLQVLGGVGSRPSPASIYDAFTDGPSGHLLALDNGSSSLADDLTSGNVTWTGTHATTANGGTPVRLWAPDPWEGGSSYSHLDEDVFPQGSPNALMTPYLEPQEVVRDPGPVVVGMLQDLGWRTGPAAGGAPVDDIDLRYAEDPGVRALLGAPVEAERTVGAVHVRGYQYGRLYTSPTTGVQVVHGDILAAYLRLGGATSYGVPLNDESAAGDGVGRFNDFSAGGSVFWSPATGAHGVGGAIRGRWYATGAVTGVLGYPVTDESRTPDGIGRYNHFSRGGSVYWTPATDAHEVHGAIRAEWAATGWERGPTGYPTTDESTTPGGVGRYNHFSKGASIYYSPTSGAHEVHGLIHAEWAASGWEAGPAGFPTTDEQGTADGAGRANQFSKGATIVWNSATGAHEVHGAIRDRWNALGGVLSYLRYPVTDEFGVPGGRRSNFSGGYVDWSPALGARDHRG